jgi:hypothetical protein
MVQAQTLSAPVFGKRSHAADDPKELLWLKEIHNKIWNQERLRPVLFREVEATQADYAALQERLKELHSDRDSPGYNGNKNKIDVLRVKLDFLRSHTSAKTPSASASSSRHPDPNDNEGSEMYSYSSRYKSGKGKRPGFFSLSAKGDRSKNRRTDGKSDLILLASELIKKYPQGSGGSEIVGGQPGLGEFLVSMSHRI